MIPVDTDIVVLVVHLSVAKFSGNGKNDTKMIFQTMADNDVHNVVPDSVVTSVTSVTPTSSPARMKHRVRERR